MKLNWRSRDSERVKYLIRRGMFQDLEHERLLSEEAQPLPEASQWATNQWDYVKQLRAWVLHLDKQYRELYKEKGVRYNKFEDESVNSVNP